VVSCLDMERELLNAAIKEINLAKMKALSM